MATKNLDIVLVCDRIDETKDINLFSTDLECTSSYYYNSLYQALANISSNLYYYETLDDFIDNIAEHKNDLIISSVWSGTKSRNRKVLLPSICEAYNIPFIGADAYVQAIAQDKVLSKLYCEDFNVCIPKGIRVISSTNLDILKSLPYPVVVKPMYEGSSIGISDNSIADNFDDAASLCRKLFPIFPTLLVEEYIPGEEVSCCIAGVNGEIDLLEFIGISIDGNDYFEHELWGYETKKKKEKETKRKIITNKIDPKHIETMREIFLSLGKVDFMRIDGRMHDNKFYLIELTPDCNLQPNCFMGTAFLHKGYSYEQMLSLFIKNALKFYNLSDYI